MSYLTTDCDYSPSEIDISTTLPEHMMKRRTANRSVMLGFIAAAFVGIATFASAVEPTTSTPEPTSMPSSSSTKGSVGPDGSGYEGNGSRTILRRLFFPECLGRCSPSQALSGRAVQAIANRLHISI